MINKLKKIKDIELEQLIIDKQKILNNIEILNANIIKLKENINQTNVESTGHISDFYFLYLNRSVLNEKIKSIEIKKESLLQEEIKYVELIKNKYQEIEQYKYLLEQEKIKAKEKILKEEHKQMDEIIQFKYFNNK